ncbi:uncharacterized protein C8R40DRAFT_1071621 [Lentinula edodes]|uniref:uncharacterized protein n=1 Tax=Lentinula edodes TaxID=5353 RepID=UPI001E8EABE1|nr:uncharacterized protein C8R40DRAFT_1071621 [Lentinula edodes]KAH7872701.1 hypothetical protein C8R40DRAFT_1071621 [Lentinula edodes]
MSLIVPPWLRAKVQALSLFFSKGVTDAKEDDQTLQPFAIAIYTELQERANSKTWRRFLNQPWTTPTFTEQQWLFICHPLFHINLLHLLKDKKHQLLNLGTEKHQLAQVPPSAVDKSFCPLTHGGGWRSMVQKANSALEKHQEHQPHASHQSSDPFLQTLDDLFMLFEQRAYSNVAINISLVVAKALGPCRPDTLVNLETKWMKLKTRKLRSHRLETPLMIYPKKWMSLGTHVKIMYTRKPCQGPFGV